MRLSLAVFAAIVLLAGMSACTTPGAQALTEARTPFILEQLEEEVDSGIDVDRINWVAIDYEYTGEDYGTNGAERIALKIEFVADNEAASYAVADYYFHYSDDDDGAVDSDPDETDKLEALELAVYEDEETASAEFDALEADVESYGELIEGLVDELQDDEEDIELDLADGEGTFEEDSLEALLP